MEEEEVLITVDVPNLDDQNTHTPSTAEICLTIIEDKLSLISPESTLSYGTLCIYKVPEKHRNKNQEAYAPRLVSIGLVHHGEAHLQAMEEYKLKYLSNFLNTFQVPLSDLVQHVDGEEGKLVFGCYEDIYVQNAVQKSKVASQVILMDGIFVVELFLKNYFAKLREKGDMVFDNSTVSSEILHDMLLFENQLPYRFLCTLYEKFAADKVGHMVLDDDPKLCRPSFNELAHVYFRGVGNAGKLSLRSIDFRHARHFVEFLSMLHMPDDKERHRKMNKEYIDGKKLDFSKCLNATQLKAVGVKFRKGAGSCLLDISFKDGVLTIPPLTVNSWTETFFRNLIAFEQSGYYFKYTTSFVILLDNLIDTANDVEILAHHEIIKNELASDDQVADLFNTLYKEFLADPREFYFVEECRLLNDYSRHWWHKLVAMVVRFFKFTWRKYFSTNPWSPCSLIAALAVLALTATQTAYAIKSYKPGTS